MPDRSNAVAGTTSTEQVIARGRTSPPSSRSRAPARRTSPASSPGKVRVSPYPSRARTPPQSSPAPAQRARVSLDSSPHTEDEHRLQLIVGPIVKNTVGHRDTSGKRLEDFVANGQAAQLDGVWSIEEPVESEWSKGMPFKWNRHFILTTKTDQGWNRWVASLRGQTVTLMIYEYGIGIPNARSLDEFLTACVRPEHTDRAGATAESSLREVVSRLREVWGATYQGSAVVWRMWANDITQNLDRSTWEVSILDPPTARVERLLRAVDSEMELHIGRLTRSLRMALDCVNAAIADNERLQSDWKAFGLCLTNQRQVLAAHKESIDGFFEDLSLPAATDVVNPLTNTENVEDTEHQ
ncbi:hypothetical protein ON010_g9650 [Phytophthora cinnamomi]|nr:hypothetical protein ON010_g9650 [Phytophthora cinnamomi]